MLNHNYFANALHCAARKKGITQEALADKIDKSKNTVAQMFTGQRFTSIPTLINLCRVLDITPDYLLAAYLPQTTNMAENEYHTLMKSINELKPGEIHMAADFIELLKNNREKQ